MRAFPEGACPLRALLGRDSGDSVPKSPGSANPFLGPARVATPGIKRITQASHIGGPIRQEHRGSQPRLMPRGNRPSTAACTRVGARKASEIVIFTCRMLHFSRAAICSTLTAPATISSSHRRLARKPVPGAGLSCSARDQTDKPSIAYSRSPLGRSIAETSDANTPGQSSFDGSLHQRGVGGKPTKSRHRPVECSHCSRAAICSTLTAPATISSSQRRPRAIDATSVARVSQRGSGERPVAVPIWAR